VVCLHCVLPSFPTRRSSDLGCSGFGGICKAFGQAVFFLGMFGGISALFLAVVGAVYRTVKGPGAVGVALGAVGFGFVSVIIPKRSEEHTSELQSRFDLVCRL